MATTITAPNVTVTTGLQYAFTITVDGVSAPVPTTRASVNTAFTSSHVERCYVLKDQTLLTTASTTIDLTTAFASALTNVRLFAVIITSSTGSLTVGGTVANGNALWFSDISDKTTHYPTGPQFIQGNNAAAVTVDGTHKVVQLENASAATVTYDVIVCGDD